MNYNEESLSSQVELFKKKDLQQHNNTVESDSNKCTILKEAITTEHIEQMIRNQREALIHADDPYLMKKTIPLLLNALPKMLGPYITKFSISNNSADTPFTPLELNCPREGDFPSSVIDSLGYELAFELDRTLLESLINTGERNFPVSIPQEPIYLAENLDELATQLESDSFLGQETFDKNDVIIICNDSDEALLQSTKKYHRMNILGLEQKLFRVGTLLNKRLVYMTPAMDQGKFLIIAKRMYALNFYKLLLLNYRGQRRFVARFVVRSKDPTCHKLVYVKDVEMNTLFGCSRQIFLENERYKAVNTTMNRQSIENTTRTSIGSSRQVAVENKYKSIPPF
ncbi:MAG: hypothetical protein QXI16_03250 [Sulfolobaceae archaeon]